MVVREGRVLGPLPKELQPEQGAENIPRGFPADSRCGPAEVVRREGAGLLRAELLQHVRPPHQPARVRDEALRGVHRVRESPGHRRGYRHRVHGGGVELLSRGLHGGCARGRWDRDHRQVSGSDTSTLSLPTFLEKSFNFFFFFKIHI